MKNCEHKASEVSEMQRMCNDVRMSRELKERELIEKAKQGDKPALLALYEQYTPLLKKLCRNRADYSNVLETDDLMQECFLALKSATNRYSFNREASFKTYLYSRAKWHLNRVITKHSNFTGNQLSMILQIKKFRESYEKEHGRVPDDGLVMHEFLISRDFLRELDILKDLKVTSIDVPISEESENTLAELLPGVTDLEEKAVKKLSVAEFWEILNDILLPAESESIKLFYLDGLTVSQIAEHTGDTEKQVQQLRQQALKKLRMRRKIKEII